MGLMFWIVIGAVSVVIALISNSCRRKGSVLDMAKHIPITHKGDTLGTPTNSRHKL